ncbi:MAG: transposase [Verrucomicrobiota bacterium]
MFFIAINAAKRGGTPLLAGHTAAGLIASVRHLHDRGDWFARLFVVMPDHVHGLISFPSDQALAQRIAAWKGYTAKSLRVEWQQRFFDHRLRNDESLNEKAHYIRMNPVRAGLVAQADAWPHVFDAFQLAALVLTVEPVDNHGSAGTPRPTF